MVMGSFCICEIGVYCIVVIVSNLVQGVKHTKSGEIHVSTK